MGYSFFEWGITGKFVAQMRGQDYILPDDGQSGTVQLVRRYGARVASGGQGSYALGSTTFMDPSGSFLTDLKAGYRIRITSGDAAGSYIVQSVL